MKDQFIGMSIKQNRRIKHEKNIFSNQTLFVSIDYLFYFRQMKLTMLKDLMFKNIIFQKVESKIIL